MVERKVSTADLIREVIDESQSLLKTEVALARDEFRREVHELRVAAIAIGAAALLMTLGLAMLLVSLILAIPPHWLSALIAGLILVMMAAGAGLLGYSSLPKKPMEQTKERLETDVHMLKERVV
jgi:uncharacterized membrane protein YqjE